MNSSNVGPIKGRCYRFIPLRWAILEYKHPEALVQTDDRHRHYTTTKVHHMGSSIAPGVVASHLALRRQNASPCKSIDVL
jgi:hypothetical protein